MLLEMVLSHLRVERDWLKMLNDEISFKSNTFFDISKKEVKDINVAIQIVKKFPDVFTDKLGVYESDPIKLKPRPHPFSLKASVEAELTRIEESEEILTGEQHCSCYKI